MVNEKVYQALMSESAKIGTWGHGFTYSGHPVAAAVALEAQKIYDEIDLFGHVQHDRRQPGEQHLLDAERHEPAAQPDQVGVEGGESGRHLGSGLPRQELNYIL